MSIQDIVVTESCPKSVITPTHQRCMELLTACDTIIPFDQIHNTMFTAKVCERIKEIDMGGRFIVDII